MKRHKQISALLAVSLLFGNGALAQAHWADAQLNAFVQQGYLVGDETGSLRPDEKITRAELCTLINRVFSFTYQEPAAFSDSNPSDWFYDDINIAVANGYLRGYEDNTVRPMQAVTREECAVMLCNAMKLTEDVLGIQDFSDHEDIASWSAGSIGALAFLGIINGYADGTFCPQNPVTRAEAVTMLSKAAQEDIRIREDIFLERIDINKNIIVEDQTSGLSVTIQDVKSEADLILYGTGNTITVKDSTFRNIILLDSTGTSHLILSDVKGEVLLQSGAVLSGEGSVPQITVQDKMEPGTEIVLDGDFSYIQVEAPQAELSHTNGTIKKLQVQETGKQTAIKLGEASTVDEAVFYAAVQITGGANIKKADFYVAGSTMDKNPQEKHEYYTVSQARPNTGGGGGGGSASKPSSPPTPKPTQAPPENPDITEDVIEGVKIGSITSNSAILQWDALENVSEYRIYQEEKQIATAENHTKPLVLEPYTPYELRVQAVFKDGSLSQKSEPVYFVTPDTAASVNERMEEWNQDRLGIFLHWGGYAALEGTYAGPDTNGDTVDFKTDPQKGQDPENIQKDAQIPADVYRSLVEQGLTAENYHPAKLVQIIKDAGIQYVIITAKSRDGLALFDSSVPGAWTARETIAGRDLLKEFTEEAGKAGLSVGVAYSQAVDWAQENADDLERIVTGQIQELLGYGIESIWWDTGTDDPALNYQVLKAVRQADPDKKVRMNNLLTGADSYTQFPFDYVATENFEGQPDYRFWERGICLNDSKGYNPLDQNYKDLDTLSHALVKTAGEGGNLLLHAGLRADGTLAQPIEDILGQLREWTAENGVSIYETEKSPFAFRLPFGYATQKEESVFLHLEQYPQYGVLSVPGLDTPPERAYLLSQPEQELSIRKNSQGGFDIGGLPQMEREEGIVTMAMEFASLPGSIARPEIMPDVEQDMESGALTLNAYQAMISGGVSLDYETADWTADDGILKWNVNAAKPGTFSVYMRYACGAGGSVRMVLKQNGREVQTMEGKYSPRGGVDQFGSSNIGSLSIPQAGEYEIELYKTGGAMTFSGLSLSDSLILQGEQTVQKGQSITLSAVNAQGAVTWTVEGSAAEVQDGVVTGLTEGICTVTAVDEAGRSGQWTVWVLEHALEENRIAAEAQIGQETVLKLQSADGAWTNLEQDLTTAVQATGPGIYRCEAWMRTDAPSGAASFFVGMNDDWQERALVDVTNTEWKKISFYIDAREPVSSLIIKPVDNLADYQEYPLYLGAVSVTPLGGKDNLVVNGDFSDLAAPVAGWSVSENLEAVVIDPNTPIITIIGEHALEQEGVITLQAKVSSLNQAEGSGEPLIWSSDNETVASVEDGVVTGHSPGTAVIWAEDPQGLAQAPWSVTVIDGQLNELMFEPVDVVEGNILQIQKGAEWSNMEQNFSDAAKSADGSIYKISLCYRADTPVSVRMALQYNNDWNVPPVFTADTQWTKVTLYLRLPQLEEGMIASLKPFDNINDTDAVLQIADISIEKVGSQGQNLIQNGQFLDGENGWSFAGAARSIIETQ